MLGSVTYADWQHRLRQRIPRFLLPDPPAAEAHLELQTRPLSMAPSSLKSRRFLRRVTPVLPADEFHAKLSRACGGAGPRGRPLRRAPETRPNIRRAGNPCHWKVYCSGFAPYLPPGQNTAMKTHILVVLLLALQAQAAEFYVSPDGNDRYPGTPERPFRTLEQARDAIRSLKASTGLPESGVTVWLAEGVYQLTATLEFCPDDGGTASAPIVYRARPGAEVRLSGGRMIPAEAFVPVTDPTILQKIPAQARDGIHMANLNALDISDFGRHQQYGHGLPVVPAPMELIWNDSVMQLARYPNEGAILMGEVVDTGSVPRTGDYSDRPGSFRYTDLRHGRWAGVSDVWFQGYFNHGFADDKIRVASIDTVQQIVRFASPHMYGLGSGENFNLYVALNLLEELDTPGEWYVDRQAGVLYFWPPGDLHESRLTVSLVEGPLVAIEGASHLGLEGLAVECGRGAGITIEGGEQVAIVDCVIRNVGTVGIMMGQGARQTFPHITADDFEGVPVSREVGSFHSYHYLNTTWERNVGRGHRIEGCRIYNTGSGGIILGGGSKKELRAGKCVVTDCTIHDFDRRNKAGAAGIIVDGCGNRVVHNEIFNGDLQAILVRGNEHLFEFNHIHHVARNSNDASAWYNGRDPSDRGNIVRHNFFHHVGRPDRKWTMGVYFDDGTCGATAEGNVFYKVASYGTVYSNGGHDIVVRNNIFIEGYGPAFQLKSMWYDFAMFQIPYYFGEHGIYRRRLTEVLDITRPPYSERYPLLTDWMDLMPDGKTYVGMLPRRNVVEHNVVVNYEETFRLVGKHAQCTFGENYFTREDPGFVDPASLNFALRDDSIIYDMLPAFQRIPFEQIGPRSAEQRARERQARSRR